MKRILLILLCALLVICPALSESAPDTPDAGDGAFSGELPPGDGLPSVDGLSLQINGESLRLNFDDSPLYSLVQNGLVQASFSAYGSDGETMYILYMIFPDTVRAGMVLTPEYGVMTGEECSVALIVSNRERELYYFSGVVAGRIYPEDSSYSITLDSIEAAGDVTAFSGKLSATLVSTTALPEGESAPLTIPETEFSFSIGGFQGPKAGSDAPVPDDMRRV